MVAHESMLSPAVAVQDVPAGGREGGHVGEMQRQRLLLATTELVAEGGFEDATVGRICKRAHVSRRTFYDQFDDREACLLAALERETGRISRPLLAAYKSEPEWRDQIRATLIVLLDFVEREPAVAQLCVIEATRGPRIVAYRKHILDALIRAIDQGRNANHSAEPPQLTAESAVGGAISVIATQLSQDDRRPLSELTNPLMSMIVYPYLGAAASKQELKRPSSTPAPSTLTLQNTASHPDPFRDLPIRITFRTARVLATIAADPGASNRQIGRAAGVPDQGQMSKLLARLQRHDLIANNGNGHAKGESNSWTLTPRGQTLQNAINIPQDNEQAPSLTP